MEATWLIGQMDGADVRLRSAQGSGLMELDVSAPVRAGELRLQGSSAQLDLTIALDRIKTGNFLTEHAARAFIAGYRAHDLVYSGVGTIEGPATNVSGPARAGTIDVDIDLVITPLGDGWHSLSEIEIVGNAGFGRVHIPLPGVGTVDDLVIDIDARLAVSQGDSPSPRTPLT